MLSTEQSMKEYNLDTITCPIHSFETFGAVDGPGIRFVIFTQGCNLQCKYCQNSDTWAHQGGTTYSVRDVLNKIDRYKNYIIPSGGGVTVSGGEPLLNSKAIIYAINKIIDENLEVLAIGFNTNGTIYDEELIDALLRYTQYALKKFSEFYQEKFHNAPVGITFSDDQYHQILKCKLMKMIIKYYIMKQNVYIKTTSSNGIIYMYFHQVKIL